MDDYGNELTAQNLQQVNARFDKGAQRMAIIERDLTKATQELHATRKDLQEVLDILAAMRGGFRVLDWLGKLAKPLSAIVILCVAIYSAWINVRGGGGS